VPLPLPEWGCEDEGVTIILEVLSTFVGQLLGESVVSRVEAATDRRLIAKNRVRCGIRAVEGRVLNTGTEWSGGVCELTPGHLRFEPSIGIVGAREIDVIDVRVAHPQPSPTMTLLTGESLVLVVSTSGGELLWAVPRQILNEVRERIRPNSAP
jgi:hypothetical protein